MSSLNKVIIIGRVGKDAELKYTPSGVAVANFSVATSEKWKDNDGNPQEKTEWHSITAWKKTAEICGEYVKKGGMVCVEGKLETQSWEKDGVKHSRTIINAGNVVLLGSKNDKAKATELSETAQDFNASQGSDGDLPF